jgi:hypothetical protein
MDTTKILQLLRGAFNLPDKLFDAGAGAAKSLFKKFVVLAILALTGFGIWHFVPRPGPPCKGSFCSAPDLVSKPPGVTAATTATFKLTARGAGGGAFVCALDAAFPSPCPIRIEGPRLVITYSGLTEGVHYVRIAGQTRGKDGPVTTWAWTVTGQTPAAGSGATGSTAATGSTGATTANTPAQPAHDDAGVQQDLKAVVLAYDSPACQKAKADRTQCALKGEPGVTASPASSNGGLWFSEASSQGRGFAINASGLIVGS